MKTYYFWVTPEGKGPMKVAEDGRTATEAKQIVEARLLHEAIAVMDTETKTRFMNKLIEIEKKAFPDD